MHRLILAAVVAASSGTIAVVAARVGFETSSGATRLPRAGFAVEDRQGVLLLDLAGRRRGYLAHYRFSSTPLERTGQVELLDANGDTYELRGGVIRTVPKGTVWLAGGYAIRFRTWWSLLRAGAVVRTFEPYTHLELDSPGFILSAVPLPAHAAGAKARALDLRTGAIRSLPAGCRVGARNGTTEFQPCGYPYVSRKAPSQIVVVSGNRRRTLAGAAEKTQRGEPAGWWRSISVSPDGAVVLGQWSGVCEIPSAYVIDVRSGVMTRLEQGGQVRAAEANALGWDGDAALVWLPKSACGASAAPAGIYRFPHSGAPQLIHQLPTAPTVRVRLWR